MEALGTQPQIAARTSTPGRKLRLLLQATEINQEAPQAGVLALGVVELVAIGLDGPPAANVNASFLHSFHVQRGDWRVHHLAAGLLEG